MLKNLIYLSILLLLGCAGSHNQDTHLVNDSDNNYHSQNEVRYPEVDTDNDGISDSLDLCPDNQEDFDEFEDTDGCPDIDNDQDGILDTLDSCINKAETYNHFEDNDGCPDIKPVDLVYTTSHPDYQYSPVFWIQFKFDDADHLYEDHYEKLDTIIKSLLKWPEVRVRITGHSDTIGSESYNEGISLKRAELVGEYFIINGIVSSRIELVGKGHSEPIADNNTAVGRAINQYVKIEKID